YSFSEKEISDSGNNYSPAISVDNRNNVHIVWECNNDEKIYYTSIVDGKKGKNIKVDGTGGKQFMPDIWANDDVYIVWVDTRNYGYDIYYSKNFSKGIIVNEKSGWMSFPSISGNDEIVIIAWQNGSLGISYATISDSIERKNIYYENAFEPKLCIKAIATIVWCDNDGIFYTNGELLYKNFGTGYTKTIDIGFNAKIENFRLNASVPQKTKIDLKVKASPDNKSLSNFSGEGRYFILELLFSTSDSLYSPLLYGIEIEYIHFEEVGCYISDYVYHPYQIKYMNATLNAYYNNCEIEVLFSSDSFSWYKDNFTSTEKFRYKIILSGNGSRTPILYEMKINYSMESYPSNVRVYTSGKERQICAGKLIKEYLEFEGEKNFKIASSSPGIVELNISYKVDRPPYLKNSPILQMYEDSSNHKLIDLYEIFGDEAMLEFAIINYTNSSFVNVSINLNYLSVYSKKDNWTGDVEINISAKDSRGMGVFCKVNLSILSVNDPPIILSRPLTNIVVHHTYTYKVEFFDCDSKTIFFSLDNCPDGMQINQDGLIKWKPKTQGNYPIIVNLSDGKNFTTQYFVLNVLSDNETVSKQDFTFLFIFTLLIWLGIAIIFFKWKRKGGKISKKAKTRTKCDICLGYIKPMEIFVKCTNCNNAYHANCAKRIENCPKCNRKF
ncbi:MAG: hypothetical protein AB1779_09800, partial [Candidatus Thermoplasmatota archaeon]